MDFVPNLQAQHWLEGKFCIHYTMNAASKETMMTSNQATKMFTYEFPDVCMIYNPVESYLVHNCIDISNLQKNAMQLGGV